MRLLRSSVQASSLDLSAWDRLADSLRENKGALGDLGGGNHFLDALVPYDDGPIYFLIHTGSRNESGHVDNLIETRIGLIRNLPAWSDGQQRTALPFTER